MRNASERADVIDLAIDWKEHTGNPDLILARLNTRLGYALTDAEIVGIGALACHLYGEHLGEWAAGLDYLGQLRAKLQDKSSGAAFKLERQSAILLRSSDPAYQLASYSRWDQLYIVGLALPAIALRGALENAEAAYTQALMLLNKVSQPDGEAARFLAIVITNLICDLIEQPYLTEDALSFLARLDAWSESYWQAHGNKMDRERAAHRSRRAQLLVARPAGYGSGRYPRYSNIEV